MSPTPTTEDVFTDDVTCEPTTPLLLFRVDCNALELDEFRDEFGILLINGLRR